MSDNWQPIDSAPKDGTRVLLFDVKKLQWPKVGYSMGNGYWWTEPGAYQIQPTHWQPLPEPPTFEKGKQCERITALKFQLEARAWRCPCGEICQPVSALWRFNGAGWEHGHEYPTGHVAAVRDAKKVAVHTGDGWYLCEENLDGDTIDENGIPWPKDWPDYVTSEFLEERGFEVC